MCELITHESRKVIRKSLVSQILLKFIFVIIAFAFIVAISCLIIYWDNIKIESTFNSTFVKIISILFFSTILLAIFNVVLSTVYTEFEEKKITVIKKKFFGLNKKIYTIDKKNILYLKIILINRFSFDIGERSTYYLLAVLKEKLNIVLCKDQNGGNIFKISKNIMDMLAIDLIDETNSFSDLIQYKKLVDFW